MPCVLIHANPLLSMEAIMHLKKTNFVALMTCVMMLAAAPLLPMSSAYAKSAGGGNSAGHGSSSSAGGQGVGHSADADSNGRSEGHSVDADSNGRSEGLDSDHDGKAIRDHGVSGKHTGSTRHASKGHGPATSGIAHSKTTHGLTKAAAISTATPGDHNEKGLSNAATSSTKQDQDKDKDR